MFISDLIDLEDITYTLVFEDEPSIFTEDYAVELVETALHLMDEYVYCNPEVTEESDFHDILLEEIKDIFYIQLEDYIENKTLFLDGEDVEDDMNEILEDALHIFITLFHQERDGEREREKEETIESEFSDTNEIEQKIQGLRDIPQPVQRTPEWYKFRWNLITASNAWKAFESQSAINQLIYEKCQPLKTVVPEEEEVKLVNTNSPLHWGQKYEPLTVMIYEHEYKTKVEDFGCIQHPTYKFIGASPDGIIVNPESDRYGRMLEIKNVVSREITGIPKKEYWVQMQLQMEVCDLDECDFLETKFVEYPDEAAFLSDENKTKGIILYFHTKEGKPFYKYKPLEITDQQDIQVWEETELEKYECAPYNYIFLKFIYWKLERFSCVLVKRNKEWFQNSVGQLEKVWNIIEDERVSGYEHRAPNRKPRKEKPYPFAEPTTQGCLLKIVKLNS